MTADKNLEKIEKRMFSITQSGKELQTEMQGLANVVSKLNDSDGLGKTWGIISRMSSGIFPNFWSIQNKVRAVTIMFDNHYKKQREQVAKQIGALQQLENIQKVPKFMSKDHTKLSKRNAMGGYSDFEIHYDMVKDSVKEFRSMERMYKSALGKEFDDGYKELLLSNIKGQVQPSVTAKKRIEDNLKANLKRQRALQDINKQFKNNPVRRFFAKRMLTVKAFLRKSIKFAETGLKVFKAFIIWLPLVILLLFTLKKTFDLLKEPLIVMEELIRESLGIFGSAFMLAIEHIGKGIQDVLDGLENGDFFLVLSGLIEILVFTLGAISVAIVGTIVTLIGALVVGVMAVLAQARENGKNFADTVGTLLLIAGTIGLIVAAIYATPAMISVAIYSLMATMLGGIMTTTGFSTGGVVNSNMQLVGEKGAELVSLPRGSRVHSNADSKRMLRSSGGNTINVHVNGRVGASDAEIRDIANKVAREINLRMSRTGSGVNNF